MKKMILTGLCIIAALFFCVLSGLRIAEDIRSQKFTKEMMNRSSRGLQVEPDGTVGIQEIKLPNSGSLQWGIANIPTSKLEIKDSGNIGFGYTSEDDKPVPIPIGRINELMGDKSKWKLSAYYMKNNISCYLWIHKETGEQTESCGFHAPDEYLKLYIK